MNYYNDFMNTPQMFDALRASSVSAEDANLRGREYAKMFARNDEMRDMLGMSDGNLFQKTFSGYAETPLLSTQYFNASVASYVKAIFALQFLTWVLIITRISILWVILRKFLQIKLALSKT